MKKFIALFSLILVLGIGGAELFKLEKPSAAFSAVAGPDQSGSDHYSWNGVVIYPFYTKVRTATSTLCSFKSPAATTTLRSFVVNLTTSSTSASTVYLAKGASFQATTTNFETVSVGASGQVTIVASTTGRTSGLPVISPNTYLTVGLNLAGIGAGTVPVGTCSAVLEGV